MNTTHPRQTTDQPRSSLLGRLKPAAIPQLRLTAMMDVVFLLLIFFVLTANFAIDEGVFPADLPGPGIYDPPPLHLRTPIFIELQSIGVDGVSYWIRGINPVTGSDFDQLYQKLNGWRFDKNTNPTGLYESDSPVVIQSATDVRWEHVVGAFNAATRAHYTNIQFSRSDR